MLVNSRKIITKVENRTNSLSTIYYLPHKQVGGGRLSSHTIQGSINTNPRLIWYNHKINYLYPNIRILFILPQINNGNIGPC